MTDSASSTETTPPPDDAPAAAPIPPKRSPGHRGQDVRDTVAELAARAHEISLEAGSKMASALKDVINAAAGVTNFAVESARDLVQYMVRRGQMTQDEADKLIREAEEANKKRGGGKPAPPPRVDGVKRPAAAIPPVAPRSPLAAEPKAAPPKPAPVKAAVKSKPAPAKKPVAKKPAAKAAKKPKKG